MSKLIEPNEHERRNGWTAETLTAYVNERRKASQDRVDWNHPSRRKRPDRANGHRWAFRAGRSWTRRASWQR